MENDERENLIIAKAKEFLTGEFTASAIDAFFAYDVDPEWNWRINKIRTRALGRETPFDESNESDSEEGVKIWVDSEELWDAEIYRPPIVFGNGKSNIHEVWDEYAVLKPHRKNSPMYRREIVLEDGKYYEKIELDAGTELNRLGEGDRAKELFCRIIYGDEQARVEYDERVKEAREYEAAIVMFNNALRHLAKLYHLDAKIVREAVLWGHTPEIPVKGEYVLSEWQRGKVRHIMISSHIETLVRPPPKRKREMSKEIRVRTWTIYRLSKRGGGQRTLTAAIRQWNDTFAAEFLDPDKRNNFIKQLHVLLDIKKRKELEKWRASMGFPDYE